jgi:hypothetical protein
MSTEPDGEPTVTIVQERSHYRGTRRAPVPRWRRYPAGATFIVALLVLITGAVVFRTFMGAGEPPPKRQVDGWQPPVMVDPSPDASGMTTSPDAPNATTTTDRGRTPVPNRTATTTTAPPPSVSTLASPPRSSSPSPSPPPPPAGVPIVGIGGKCVEVATDAERVYIDDCASTDRQRWTRTGDTVRALGKCLDVRNGSRDNGAQVWLYACNGTGAQVWEIRADRTWRNPQSGRCLTTNGGSSADGTRLMIWTCTGASYQRWTM